MKTTPCELCLIRTTCIKRCMPEIEFDTDLSQQVDKFRRYIYSKNGRIRKNVPNQKRKHWNAIVKTYNDHTIHVNKRVERMMSNANQI